MGAANIRQTGFRMVAASELEVSPDHRHIGLVLEMAGIA
jgi:hypothetical protein